MSAFNTTPARVQHGLASSSPTNNIPMPISPAPLEPFVDAKAVAAHIGRSPKTVLRMAREGVIPSYCDPTMTRKHRLFKITEVDAALKLMYSHASYPCRNLEESTL
jgi:hypothetical protein